MIIGIATFNEAEGGQEKSIYLFFLSAFGFVKGSNSNNPKVYELTGRWTSTCSHT